MGAGATLGFIPGFIATELRADLGISRAQVGLMIGLFFGCTGLGSIAAGRATARFGARRVIVANMALVAATALIVGLYQSYAVLIAAAVIAGAGYALVNAGTNVVIATAIPVRRRTLAMSLKTAGVPAMAAVGAGLGPPCAARWGWPTIVLTIAATAAIAGLLARSSFSDDRPRPGGNAASGKPPHGMVWFSVAAFLIVAGTQPIYSWVVPYIEEVLAASPAVAGGITAIASAVGIVVMVGNALNTDRRSADSRIRRIVWLTVVTIVATAMVLSAERAGIWLALAGATIGIAAQLSIIGTMHAAIADHAPGAVARATGITMTGYYLGALVAPLAFGTLVDLGDNYTYGWLAAITMLTLAIPAWIRAGRLPVGDLRR